jgi:hypothetical protein
LDILNPLYCCIMSGTNYQVMLHNIPEEHTLEEEYLLEKLWHMIMSAVFFFIYGNFLYNNVRPIKFKKKVSWKVAF